MRLIYNTICQLSPELNSNEKACEAALTQHHWTLKPAHTRAICLAKCHSCHFAQHIAPVCAQFL